MGIFKHCDGKFRPLGGFLKQLVRGRIVRGEVEAEFRAQLRRFLEISPPVILMGDLNAKRTEPQLIELAGMPGITDCFGRFATGDLVKKRIDWMFVRGLNCIHAHLEPTLSSDHPWAWAELEVKAE